MFANTQLLSKQTLIPFSENDTLHKTDYSVWGAFRTREKSKFASAEGATGFCLICSCCGISRRKQRLIQQPTTN